VDNPLWIIGAALGAALAALLTVAILHRIARGVGKRSRLSHELAQHSHRAAQFAGVALAVRIAVAWTTRSAAGEHWRDSLLRVLSALVIVATAWLIVTVPVAVEAVALARLRADVPNNRPIRRMRTQVVLLRRVIVAVVCVITFGVLLMTFPSVRALGTSVLVSAGVIGAVTAFAAQSVLGNVLAGIQLVLSDAVRLDDVVVVEGEWGRVETMTLSYVAVQIWDDRRLILPTSYFNSKPFQNWTRTHAALLGTVEFDVDWAVPIQAARDEMRRLVAASHLWDRRVCVLQVTDATGGLIRLRALVSASDAGRLWDLRCQLREQMVVWLRTYQPAALPRTRTALYGVGGARPLPDAPARKGDAGRAHRRATERDTERARVFGGSVDGYARGAFFVGPHSSVHYE